MVSKKLFRMLPSEPSLFSDGWQNKIESLFPNVTTEDISRTTKEGTVTRMMVQILDQLESEIFFPVVSVQHQVTNETKSLGTAF